jgi:hypothetical protein
VPSFALDLAGTVALHEIQEFKRLGTDEKRRDVWALASVYHWGTFRLSPVSPSVSPVSPSTKPPSITECLSVEKTFSLLCNALCPCYTISQ